MNVIFIDFCNYDNLNKKEKIEYRFLKYSIKYDMLNNKFTKYISICLNKEYILNQIKRGKYGIHDNIFKKIINSKFKISEKVNLLFSNDIEESQNMVIKKYILDLLRLNSITIYNEIYIKNELKINDMKYIEKFIANNKLNIDKIKILLVIDKLENYDSKQVLKYISTFKFVDILRTNNISKFELNTLKNNIEKINNEYGTTIDIIKKRNIQKYNIYLIYSKLDKYEFLQNYILSSKSLYIDMTNIDYDYLNENNIIYKKYENEILTLLKRLNIDAEKFVKAKLGYIFK